MGDEPTQNGKRFDPMEPWRGVRDIYMDAWAKTMVDMVNSEAYAQASGAMLDSYLTVSTPFREAIEKAMLKTLEQLAMPSRADAAGRYGCQVGQCPAAHRTARHVVAYSAGESSTAEEESRQDPAGQVS
jgi:hypothetical protein